MLKKVRGWARTVKRDAVALSLAARDPRVPWYAKALAVVVVAYALSPIDLIPDFIPVLGYLDDVIIVPMGISLTVRCIPSDLMTEFREEATKRASTWRTRLSPNRSSGVLSRRDPAIRRGKNALPAAESWLTFIFRSFWRGHRPPVRLQRVFVAFALRLRSGRGERQSNYAVAPP